MHYFKFAFIPLALTISTHAFAVPVKSFEERVCRVYGHTDFELKGQIFEEFNGTAPEKYVQLRREIDEEHPENNAYPFYGLSYQRLFARVKNRISLVLDEAKNTNQDEYVVTPSNDAYLSFFTYKIPVDYLLWRVKEPAFVYDLQGPLCQTLIDSPPYKDALADAVLAMAMTSTHSCGKADFMPENFIFDVTKEHPKH